MFLPVFSFLNLAKNVPNPLKNTDSSCFIDSLISNIKDSIKEKESVYLRGFGTFLAKERKEKTGRNISKNTTIIIPAHHIPLFKPAKVFKEEVKNNVK